METPEPISLTDVTVRAAEFIHDSDRLVRGLASELESHERLVIAPDSIDSMIAALARVRAACSFERITDEVRASIANHDVIGRFSITLFDRVFYLRKIENQSDVVKQLSEIQDRYWSMAEAISAD